MDTKTGNKDEWNRLIWEFVSYYSRLSFLLAQLVGMFYEQDIVPASIVLKEEFDKLSKGNQESKRKNCNYQTFIKTIKQNENNQEVNLATIIWNHFSHFGQLLQCLKKQLWELNLENSEQKELDKILVDLAEIVELRNDLLHSWLVTNELQEGLGIYRLRFSSDGTLIKKDISGYLDLEIKKILKSWSDIKSWIQRIIFNYNINHGK